MKVISLVSAVIPIPYNWSLAKLRQPGLDNMRSAVVGRSPQIYIRVRAIIRKA